jgi:valyl-tRNA synthetase
LLIPLAGLIDMKAEMARVEKELAKLQIEFDRMSAKLSNENFIANAPKEVVEKDKARVVELSSMIKKMKEQAVQLKLSVS